MKSFFSKVAAATTGRFSAESTSSDNKNNNNPVADQATNTSLFKKTTILFGGDSGESEERKAAIAAEEKANAALIAKAAQHLNDTIQEILNDTASLKGDNVSGFERLVSTLSIINNEHSNIDGDRSCMAVLLSNLQHGRFIKICNQMELAQGLVHVLRLLRMYEIKLEKSGTYAFKKQLSIEDEAEATNPSDSPKSEQIQTQTQTQQGLTFESSEKVCIVFETLCSDQNTVEIIKSALVRLLTFPLSIFPMHGAHIQPQVAGIISVLCRTGFTDKQV